MKISFIGGGNMGEAILAALLSRGLSAKEEIAVSDVSQERLKYLAQTHDIAVTGDNREALAKGDVIILAVKPQSLPEVMAGLKGLLKKSQLVMSIIAGARVATLREGLNHASVVRVMPNTPAQIGEGMSVWTATPEVTGEQRNWAASILGATGKEIHVDDERYLDMATAVSGSGPAYIFLLAEALTNAAVAIGFSPEMAAELVGQTMLGSAKYLQHSAKPPQELRQNVTSPGGTTAAALARLEEGQFNQLLKEAVEAAFKRAQELGS